MPGPYTPGLLIVLFQVRPGYEGLKIPQQILMCIQVWEPLFSGVYVSIMAIIYCFRHQVKGFASTI